MGHAASCCYISIFPTSTASSHHEEIVEESNLKTHCSRDGVQKKQENQPHQLRLKLLHEIPFVIHHFTIIIIYAPPEFRIHDISFFVAKKVNLPLIDSNSFSSAESPNEESDQTIFETLIHSPDSQKGFVVMNYPNNPKQLRNLQTVFPESRIIPIFIDLDSETMRILCDKFDRWIHTDSERSYHAVTRPPQSLGGLHLLPNEDNMLDDHTGEPLVHLQTDTLEAYKQKFAKYHLAEALMKSCYEKFFTVPSCTSKKELYGHLLKTLSNAVAYPHTHLLSEDQSGENIRKYRKHQSDTAELK